MTGNVENSSVTAPLVLIWLLFSRFTLQNHTPLFIVRQHANSRWTTFLLWCQHLHCCDILLLFSCHWTRKTGFLEKTDKVCLKCPFFSILLPCWFNKHFIQCPCCSPNRYSLSGINNMDVFEDSRSSTRRNTEINITSSDMPNPSGSEECRNFSIITVFTYASSPQSKPNLISVDTNEAHEASSNCTDFRQTTETDDRDQNQEYCYTPCKSRVPDPDNPPSYDLLFPKLW